MRSNGSYLGATPTGPTSGAAGVASGIWDLASAHRYSLAGSWPGVGPSDPYFANVVLLLHMDGTNGGTTFTDSSSYGRTVTQYRSAQTSTAQSKFGGASAYFSGGTTSTGTFQTVDCLTIPDSNDFTLGTSDFTIECFIYVTSFAASQEYWAHRDAGGSAPLSLLRVNTDGTIRAYFNSGSTDVTSSGSVSQNTWHHVAVVRNSETTSIYIDGVLQTLTGTNASGSFGDHAADICIGAGADGATAAGWGSRFSGYIDEFRWTIGTARYTGNFTPPTEAFPDA